MAFKHYDVVRAASPSDLAERLTQKLKEGWQPFGSPVAITPYTLMQAIAAEGYVTTPVVGPDTGAGGAPGLATTEPEYYYVIPLAGQSNGMAYGEGLPLPETYDRPDSRIRQWPPPHPARLPLHAYRVSHPRSHVTPLDDQF